MGARLIATRPPDGGTAAPGAAVVAVLELDPDWSAEGVRMWLDEDEVTGRCAIRTDRGWPPRRADVVLAEVEEGEHVARLRWSGEDEASWRFRVGGPKQPAD
jgi:hypothetical protein